MPEFVPKSTGGAFNAALLTAHARDDERRATAELLRSHVSSDSTETAPMCDVMGDAVVSSASNTVVAGPAHESRASGSQHVADDHACAVFGISSKPEVNALTNGEREQQGDNQYSARARNTAADINSVTADDVEQEDHVGRCDSERSELPARHRRDDDDDVTVGEDVCSPSKDNCTSAIL